MPSDKQASLESTNGGTKTKSSFVEYSDQPNQQPSKMIPIRISYHSRGKSKTSYGMKLNEGSGERSQRSKQTIRQRGNYTHSQHYAMSSKEDSTSRPGSIEYSDQDNLNQSQLSLEFMFQPASQAFASLENREHAHARSLE